MKMIRSFMVAMALVLGLAVQPPSAAADEVLDLNRVIDQTNFIVGSGCSGTLVHLGERVILTNHHCIERFVDEVTRKVPDDDGVLHERTFERLKRVEVGQRDYQGFQEVGTITYQTEIVARSKERDLALIQIITKDVRSAIASVIPEHTIVRRGQEVYAVGNPTGLDATVTRGIVSSTTRTFRVPWANGEEVNFLQVDAAINPGNSGGALYDAETLTLVGVPAASFARADGIGLAIPVETIREFLEDNCFQIVYDPGAPTHDECVEAEEADEDEEE